MEHYFRTYSYHLPEQHALLLHGDMSEYLIGYYLNLKEQHVSLSAEHDEQLKRLLACLGLHITMRSPDESIAWTLHMLAEQPYSLFATGSSTEGFLVGQVLYENIRHTDTAVFHSQVSRVKGSSSKSVVRCETQNVPEMVETFYAQSEQLPLKIALSQDSDEVFALVAMPGFDETWFNANTPQAAFQGRSALQHKLIKQCTFRFHCNCSAEKLLPYLSSVKQSTLDELYGEDQELIAKCPRCGKQFAIARELVERTRQQPQ